MTCTVAGCRRPLEARGLCAKHYQRWRVHGDPTVVKPRGPAPQHGTRARYRKGCRDECCRSAERSYRRRYRQAQAAA